MKRVFLGRRSQRRQVSGAQGSTFGTTKRRERRILQRAASVAGEAGLRPAKAGDGEGRP